jgi:hypothetical protein
MLTILLLATMCLPVAAVAGNRVAFVVGIGSYDNLPDYRQLKNSVNDANGVSEKLKHMGFRVTYSPNVTRAQFNTQWEEILNSLTDQDTLVLFFSGHGVQIEGHNYLLPRDIPYIQHGRMERLKRESISLDELLDDLTAGQRSHPKNSVIILDACRENPFVSPGSKGISSGGLARVEPKGMFILYSAAIGGISLDRLTPSDQSKYSVFTRILLPLMERSDIDITSMARRVRTEVSQLTENIGQEQLPAYYDGIIGDFCLPGCRSSSAPLNIASLSNLASPEPAVRQFVRYLNDTYYDSSHWQASTWWGFKYSYDGCRLKKVNSNDPATVLEEVQLDRIDPASIVVEIDIFRLKPVRLTMRSEKTGHAVLLYRPSYVAWDASLKRLYELQETRAKDLLREAVVACRATY